MASRKQESPAQDVLVLSAQDREDIQFSEESKPWLLDFFSRLISFYRRATELDKKADESLAAAKAVKPPKTPEDDIQIQKNLKALNADMKDVEEQWEITSQISKFHRRLTSRRKVTTDKIEAAQKLVQAHHNKFVKDAEVKAAQEQERQRLELERQAAERRKRDLDEAEDRALEAEGATADLSDRERKFVEQYTGDSLSSGDENRSAMMAGYRKPDAGERLLKQKKIKDAIDGLMSAKAIRQQAAAVKAQPLEVEPVERVEPEVQKAAGATDRTTWKGEVLDLVAFRNAAFEGAYGIPRDIFTVDPVKLNEHARSMHELMNRWPGVQAKPTTRTF